MGQEDSWQENNQRELQRMDALKVEKHKERDEVVAELEKGNDKSEIVTLDCGKRVIPCMYYVMRLRGQYRDKRVEEIKKATEAADSATPSVSVTAEPTEQSNEMDTSTDEPAAAVKTEKSDAKVTFTLKDSQKELRLIWSNNLTPEDKEAWKAEAIKQVSERSEREPLTAAPPTKLTHPQFEFVWLACFVSLRSSLIKNAHNLASLGAGAGGKPEFRLPEQDGEDDDQPRVLHFACSGGGESLGVGVLHAGDEGRAPNFAVRGIGKIRGTVGNTKLRALPEERGCGGCCADKRGGGGRRCTCE